MIGLQLSAFEGYYRYTQVNSFHVHMFSKLYMKRQ